MACSGNMLLSDEDLSTLCQYSLFSADESCVTIYFLPFAEF